MQFGTEALEVMMTVHLKSFYKCFFCLQYASKMVLPFRND